MKTGQRQYYRLSIQTPIAFKIIRGKNPEEKTPPLKGMLKDISLGGLQFGTNTMNYGDLYIFNEFERMRDREFKPNLLLIKFSLSGEGEPFIVYCQPRWSGQGDLVDPFDFYVGAQFIRAKKEDLLRIRDYIQRHGDEKALEMYAQKTKVDERRKRASEIQLQKYALASLPMRYQIVSGQSGATSRLVNALTRNISITGLSALIEAIDIDGIHIVFDKTPLKRNTILLEVSIPGQNKPLAVKGEVRWFERLTGEGRHNYQVGIRFLNISENDKNIIAEYIQDKPGDVSGVIRRW